MNTQYFKLTTQIVEREILGPEPRRHLRISVSGPINAGVPVLTTERFVPEDFLASLNPRERLNAMRSEAVLVFKENLALQDRRNHDREAERIGRSIRQTEENIMSRRPYQRAPRPLTMEELRHASESLTQTEYYNSHRPHSAVASEETYNQLMNDPAIGVDPAAQEGGPGAV